MTVKIKKRERFGLLTVLNEAEPKAYGKSGRKFRMFSCVCDCGNKTTVLLSFLRTGHTKSCGCLMIKSRMTSNQTHGLSKSFFYETWRSMKQRCFYKKHKNYKYYGAKGITVCAEWMDFKNFHNWAVSSHYKKGYTLDRINTLGNYCPENCKWSTKIEQSRNTRRNVNIEYNGEIKCISAWAEEIDINATTLWYRIVRSKWPVEKALTTPAKSNYSKNQ